MARWAYTLTALAALSAWAGAQNKVPAPQLNTADQVRLLKANGTLITNLVDSGVELSSARSGPRARAEQCHGAATVLAGAIKDAANKQDVARVEVLAELFRDIVRDALLTTLDRAKEVIPPESLDAEKVKKLRTASGQDLRELKAALPTTGKVADSARVRDTFEQLDKLAERLK